MLDDVEQVRAAAQQAHRLTRQLLIFARSDVVHREVLDLNEVVAGLEQLLRRTLGERIELVTAPADGLWPVEADRGQLEQVLVNLAVNARDAMPGGGRLTIDTANITVDDAYAEGRPGLQPGRYARLRVADTGTGMDPPKLDRVFEPFFTTKPKGQGTGLGLATVYGIVSRAGGTLEIYSEPGLGTTVTGLLPATTGSRPRPAASPPATRRAATGRRSCSSRTRTSLHDLARPHPDPQRLPGPRGRRRRAGARAIAGDTASAIDLLLTDVVMPEMLGNEVASRVHATRPALPVLYMSGYAQPDPGHPRRLRQPDRPPGKTIHRIHPPHPRPPCHRQRHPSRRPRRQDLNFYLTPGRAHATADPVGGDGRSPAAWAPRHLGRRRRLYFILEGISEPSVAEAQAMAVTELTPPQPCKVGR